MKRKFIAFPLLLFSIVLIVPVLSRNIEDKISGYNRKSSLVRELDFAIGIDIIKNNPILGIGLTNENYTYTHYFYGESIRALFEVTEDELYNKGTTNSILWISSALGLPIFFLWLYYLFNQQIIMSNRYLFLFIIFITLLSEPLVMTPFFIIFFISGLSIKKRAISTFSPFGKLNNT